MSSEINPYASPKTEWPSTSAPKINPYTPGRARPFESAGGPGRAAIILILVTMAIEACVIYFRYVDARMVDGVLQGIPVNQVEAAQVSSFILIAERARLLATIVAAIPFFMWSYRSHRNLPALLATPLNYSPGWTIGGWFIPFANLVIPYSVVQEIHRGSDPLGLPGSSANRLGPRSAAVVCWWFCWIACGIASMVGVMMVGTQTIGQPDWQSLRVAAWLLVGASVLRVGAGVCIVLAMGAIIRNQDERHLLVAQASAARAIEGSAPTA